MRTSRFIVIFVFVLALAITGVGTTRQLAMLVEVAPQNEVAEGTLTHIVVRVAPEDRTALGEDVMLWIELSREEVRVLRRGWALKIDDHAKPIEAEIVIPNGPHVLRVDLKGAEGRSTGVWWGDVDVSVSSSDPDPDPDPDPEDSVSDSEQRQQSETAAVAVAATETVSATETTPAPVPVPVSDDSVSDGTQRQEAATAPVPVPAPDQAPSPKPQAPEPEIHESSTPNPIPKTVSGDPREGSEVTIAVTRDGLPVTGLVPGQFEIRIDGKSTPTTFFEGPGDGRTLLGIAVDLHDESRPELGWIVGMVGRLVEKAGQGATEVFVENLNGNLGWTEAGDVGSMVQPADSASAEGLSALVQTSLARFSSKSGKTFLLLVTDGSGPRAGKEWAEAHRAAVKAGVPILIAGIWIKDFPSGLRKDLRKLAAATGGSVFYVQGSTQTGKLVERFGAIIDGSYAVGVEAPPGTTHVDVSLVGVDAEVRASTAVRWVDRPRNPREDVAKRGLFTYMADAALFEDCETGQRFPVAMEADYLKAERAYLEDRAEPGAPLLVTFEGRLESRPPMEGDKMIEMIIIDRFIDVHPGEGCE